MTADPYSFDPFADDELLSEAADDRPEPSAAMKIAIMALAQPDMERYMAERQHVLNPRGPRQAKKLQRKLLFDALRTGASWTTACERAGVDRSTFDQWMQQPSFRASVERAELQAGMVLQTDDYRRW